MASSLNIEQAVVPLMSGTYQTKAAKASLREPKSLRLPTVGRPEIQLILACARTRINDEGADRIRRLLKNDLDWRYTLRKSQQHGVMPLLYKSLSGVGRNDVPEDVLEEVRQASQFNAQYNLLRTTEMIGFLRLLESKGIPAVPFKGPILAEVAYGNLALRQFGDLDILIHKRSLKTVKGLLLSRGYRIGVPLTWFQDRLPRLSKGKDFIFVKDEGRIVIELHWQLTGNHFQLPLDMKRLWKRMATVSVAGAVVHSLPPEELLLYLCTHGSRHSWERLIWICDVAEIIRSTEELDLNRVMEKASRMGVGRMLTLGLWLAHHLLEADLPAETLARIKADDNVQIVTGKLQELIFQDNHDSLDDIHYWYHHHLQVRERFKDRVRLHVHYARRYTRLVLTPSVRDREAFSLPRFLSFLYYPLRLLRLFKQHGLERFTGNVKGVRQ